MPRKIDSRFVWSDGSVISADEAKVSFFSHVLHYGTGVFEGVRCYDGVRGPAFFRLPEHWVRLRRSADAYFMPYRWTDEQLTEAAKDLVRRHGFSSCYLRPVVFMGEGRMGVNPREVDIQVMMSCWSWGRYLGPDALERGVRVVVVDSRKYDPRALDPTVKAVGHYLNSVRAAKEAEAKGYDEGLLLNASGRVAEGPGENFFLVRNGELWTNPPEESLLLGITRDAILKIAKSLGIPTKIQPLTVDDVHGADEAFFTGTAAEVTPIQSLNDRPIGTGRRGPITEQLQSVYLAAVVGRAPGFEDWLTPVND